MPVEIEKLLVTLDADVKKFENAMKRANDSANKQMRAIEDKAKAMNKNVGTIFGSLGKNVAIGVAGAGALKGFQDLIDASTRTSNALKVAGLSGEALDDVYNKLFASAQRNSVPVESLVTLYGRAAIVQKELGVSSDELIGFTDNIGKALRVAGTNAQTASGALLQLSQALGSGTVRAEEFNSIQEGALPILQAAANGIDAAGGSVSKLRNLVIQGKISSQAFFRGIQAGAGTLDSKLVGSVGTVEGAITKLNNSLQDAAGKFDGVIGASATAIKFINDLALAIQGLGNVIDAANSHGIGQYVQKLNELALAVIPGISNLKQLSEVDLNDLADALRVDDGGTEGRLKSARDAISKYLQSVKDLSSKRLATAAQFQQVQDLADGVSNGTKSVDDLDQAVTNLVKSNPKFKNMADQIKPLIDAWRDAAGAAKTAQEEMNKTFLAKGLTHPSGDTVYSETQKRNDFINKRNADSLKTDIEKNVDARAKVIMDAAGQIGRVMTEAAAKIQARAELASEATVQATTAATNGAAELIRGFEIFRADPYKDVNHLRVGYGSDTVTLADGSFREVVAGMKVSVADANRDLIRRIGDFQDGIRGKIGADTFNGMTEDQKSALTSVAYNYGELPDRIVAAIKSGDAGTVSQAINGLGADNDGINAARRAQEAKLYLSGASPDVQQRVQSTDDFAQQMKEQQQMLTALKAETGIRASLNPLLADYGQKLTEVEKAQELLKLAQQEGTAAGKELTDVQHLLTGDLTKLSPAAQAQAEAMRSLAVEYGTATAASNKLKASQEAIATSTASSVQFQKDVISGALTDIRSAFADGKIDAKEWGDILVNVLNKVADKLQQMLVDSLFSGGTGLLGGLLGGTGGVTGGLTGGAAVAARGAPRLPSASSMAKSSGVHVTVGVAADGNGNIKPFVESVARTEAGRMGRAVEGRTIAYTKGQMHRDINKHLASPRRSG